MKPLFTILLIGSFIGMAVFGFVGMHHGMQAHAGDCAAATAQGMDCPKQATLADYLAFHFDAFRKFSTATFGDIAASLLTLSLLVIAVAFGASLGKLAPPKFAYYRLERPDSFGPSSQYRFISWLALHENSPATV